MTDATPGQITTLPISFPPGLNRSNTRAAVGSSWYDSHLMRWVQGRMRPIGGWELMDLPDLGSPIRAMHVWIDNAGSIRLGTFRANPALAVGGPGAPRAGG